MQDHKAFQFSLTTVLYPFLFVVLIWTVYWVQIKYGYDFTDYGILPRTISGLKGIVFSPFLHGSIKHLYNNTFPLLILGTILFYFYVRQSPRVILYGILLSGFLTWIIGREAYHIGASGLIYVFSSFIFFKGIFTKYYRLVALSLLVVFLYGGLLWYVFPIDEEISWEGHLSGLITGFILAVFIRGNLPKPVKYAWEREDYDEENDPFLKHFDENGNFIEHPDQIPEEED
ncbi:rhomboid family intramembrane serine protease [Sinomicrobium weinanense]|uniref:Rhomboid family intramembrane serine protease n=1 Tax=Sinomicrobium weinanense TaxID=2842200 RepID=A0A926JWR1_9FLAO|nr:rhomboid family intramembrane serine protease [Sinomicrobium weinanense]MBC9798597.1 rhomboid family intramembrane serine protease [Sinomicrobium weinanense]MBU3123498.1 rhomboid family intramembrane serine protease [Sinomicrobium weinanense]